MATHFSVLAWRIPGTGKPGGLPSIGSHRVRHDWSDLAAAASYVLMLVTQLCSILCDPIDCNPPGFCVHGILQTRILEWVDIPFSKGSSQPTDWTQVSCIAGRFFTIWATRETPVYMCVYFKRQFLSNWKFWWTSVVCSIKNSLYWLNPPYCFSR